MRYLILLSMILLGCSNRKDISCFEGYLLTDYTTKHMSFCKKYDITLNGVIVGIDCYHTLMNPVNAEMRYITITNGSVSNEHQCFDARDKEL